MAIDLGIRIMQLLDSIGVKGGSYLGKASNVKKAFTGGKPTFFKPDVLETLRATDGTFTDALKLIEEESKYIANATDVEKMAFLNNLMEYKSLGGPKKTKPVGIASTNAMEEFKKNQTELQKALKDLQSTTEKNKNQALKDLDNFLTTGGQPLKAKNDKFLGGSMHEEGQLRTGIRQFLQTEYKNGRIALDETDAFRVLKYSPMSEDDPILVFKKIYGDEAYNKAGSFPGAFEIGENYKHYEEIFRNNMGEDILKVKDKKYVGDGRLVLSEMEEVVTPSPDDPDIPFAEGGIANVRQGYFKGKVVQKVADALNPKNIKKAVDNIFKTGDYKYDAQMAAESFVELNSKLFNNKLYDDLDEATRMEIYGAVLPEVRGGSKIKPYDKTTETQFNKDVEEAGGMEEFLDANPIGNKKRFFKGVEIKDPTFDETLPFDNDAEKLAEIKMSNEAYDMEKARGSVDDMSVEDSLTTLEGLGATQTAERFRLKQKYPGITDSLLDDLINDPDPNNKARALAALDEAMTLQKAGKSEDEIIEILKSTPKKEMATGGRVPLAKGKRPLDRKGMQVLDEEWDDLGPDEWDYIIKLLKAGEFSKGGRAGFYMGGQSGQSVIEPDLSDIGHGSDALMSRTRMLGPNTQATTSTGLNYLLGEDNDNTRIPFKSGKRAYDYNSFEHKINELNAHYKRYKKKGGTIPFNIFSAAFAKENFATGGRAGFNEGLLVPQPKPYTEDMFEKDSMTLLKGMYGTGPESNPIFYNKIIEKGNKLRKQGVERETVIEIIRKNKDKINAFLETQTGNKKNFEGLESFEMKANGGRIGFQDGLSAAKKYGNILVQDETLEEMAGKELKSKMSEFIPNETQKEKEEREMFEMVKDFQKFKTVNPDSMLTLRMFAEEKKKEKEIFKNKIVELDIKYPEKDIIDKKTNMVNTENLKEAIDQAEIDLELSPIDGLTLKRSINTEGEQSVTSGSFSLDNLTFTSPNLEEGQLTTTGNYNFGDLDLSGMVKSNDGEILNTKLGFNYDNMLKGKLSESDGYKSTELELNKTFPINDKINFNLTGSADTQTFNGTTYRSSDLKPKLSYNDGIFNADISKSVLEGGDTPNLGLGVNYNNFYAQGDNLLSEDRSGVLGYQKEFGNKDDDLFFTVGAEKNIFDDEYTGGVGLKYKFADGGIAGLRQGYVGGGGVDLARRGFLKILAGTAAGVAAFKTGALKLLGKTTTKAAPKFFTAEAGSGAPAWFEGMVNKVLADGVDITKKAATMDGQTVKSLDTPTGKVDVTIDRMGNVDVNYQGTNTALGEGVDLRYVVNQADETTRGKPIDEFEAIESIPEGRQTGPDDYNIEIGENTTDEVKNLFSDTSELAELGGKKELVNDISVTLQKKKKLKQMQDNPADFVTDVQSDYDPT